jgi:transcriptional regulator with XRE-family HTH domain
VIDESQTEQQLFGEKVRAAREQANLSQAAVARKIQSTQHYISDVEGGRLNVRLKAMVAIAKALRKHLIIELAELPKPKRQRRPKIGSS